MLYLHFLFGTSPDDFYWFVFLKCVLRSFEVDTRGRCFPVGPEVLLRKSRYHHLPICTVHADKWI